MEKIKVLIVDDSALIRDLFTDILNSDPALEVIATAEDPYDAREKIKSLNPDVVTLDIEMPKMDGISFLEKIMTLRPMPVVMVSSLTQKGADATFRALELGAVDYVPKTGSENFDVDALRSDLIEKVKAAARAKVTQPTSKTHTVLKAGSYPPDCLIAIGASTGGVEAIKEVLTPLPSSTPPIVITQHMPQKFTATFAERLDKVCQIHVKEAANGEIIKPNTVYIAPGDLQFEIGRSGKNYVCSVHEGEKVSGHRPSVDVLFSSVAQHAKDNAIGVMLTGMGKDGAIGMLEMKKSGARTLGQDEQSCIVYGMPKAAYLAGAIDKQLPLNQIAAGILQLCSM